MKILRAQLQDKNESELYSTLANLAQSPFEEPQNFLMRAVNLRERIIFASKKGSSNLKLTGGSNDIKMQSRPESKDSAVVLDVTNYNESFVPNVPLSEDLLDEQEELVRKMLNDVNDV